MKRTKSDALLKKEEEATKWFVDTAKTAATRLAPVKPGATASTAPLEPGNWKARQSRCRCTVMTHPHLICNNTTSDGATHCAECLERITRA